MPVLHPVSSSLFVIHTYQLDTVSPDVGYVCCLHQRTPLNHVQSLKLQMRRYVPMSFIRTHLIVLTICVIIAGQLNVNS